MCGGVDLGIRHPLWVVRTGCGFAYVIRSSVVTEEKQGMEASVCPPTGVEGTPSQKYPDCMREGGQPDWESRALPLG